MAVHGEANFIAAICHTVFQSEAVGLAVLAVKAQLVQRKAVVVVLLAVVVPEAHEVIGRALIQVRQTACGAAATA